MLGNSRALGRAVGSSADDITETRFPTHVLGNVHGAEVQEHGWEIACASKHGRVREIWLCECAGPVCEQGAGGIRLGIWPFPGFSCVRVRVLSCADVSSESGRMASPPLGVWPYGLWTLSYGVASFVQPQVGVGDTTS